MLVIVNAIVAHSRIMKSWHLRKTIEVQFFEHPEDVRFRIEVYGNISDVRAYLVRLFRYDGFRIKPSFGDFPRGGADHEIFVSDLLLDGREVEGDSPDEVLDFVLETLLEQGFK